MHMHMSGGIHFSDTAPLPSSLKYKTTYTITIDFLAFLTLGPVPRDASLLSL